jgi:hypothetical protein
LELEDGLQKFSWKQNPERSDGKENSLELLLHHQSLSEWATSELKEN